MSYSVTALLEQWRCAQSGKGTHRITKEITVGELYRGTVVSVKEFGAFVEVLPGKDGLCHISELAEGRVNRTEDIVKPGDMLWVKCIGVDDRGRVKLSRKAAMKDRGESVAQTPKPAVAVS